MSSQSGNKHAKAEKLEPWSSLTGATNVQGSVTRPPYLNSPCQLFALETAVPEDPNFLRCSAGLWTVFTLGGVGSKRTSQQEESSPLANQSLLLLLVLVNLTDAADTPNPYKQSVVSFKNTQDSTALSSPTPHAFQINFNSLYTTLCEQQNSDHATLLLYTLLHQNSNVRTYMLARTDMENLVNDGFNQSIHEVILKNITWYSERVLTEISLGSLLILVVIRTIQYNMTRTRDKYLHTNCLAALANMSAQFRSLHQYAAQRIIR
ncbi:hypothetical protein E2320_017788 [Naja naja]|nr:hypothetical protein E2320_017788 [Naja naja]